MDTVVSTGVLLATCTIWITLAMPRWGLKHLRKDTKLLFVWLVHDLRNQAAIDQAKTSDTCNKQWAFINL